MAKSRRPETLQEALAIIDSQQLEIDALRETAKSVARENQASGVWRSLRGLLFYRRSQQAIECVEQSPFFDAGYYASQVAPGRRFRSVRQAIRHYLKTGAAQGLDPCPVFDTRWYLSKYPDVRSSGYNPLLHFLLFGLAEGRLPGPSGLTPDYIVRKEPTRADELRLKAWGGFPQLVMPKLARLADDHMDAQAAWALAGWYYAHGDFEQALQRVMQVQSFGDGELNKSTMVAMARCYAQLGMSEETIALVKETREKSLHTGELPYVAANAAIMSGDPSKGMLALSEVYTRAGLCPVSLKTDKGAASTSILASLASDAPPVIHEGPQAKVSVVIPAYNAAGTLPIALNSLLKQTWRSLEIIVVDDCSEDDTEEVVKAFAAADGRVAYLRNEQNMGAYPSRNRGMKAATGDFVTVHDSDDWSHPQKIERQVQPLLLDSSKVATYSAWVRVTEGLLFVGPWLLGKQFIEKNHSSLLLRAEVLADVGPWDSVNVAGDTEFLWRLESRYGVDSLLGVLPTTPLSLALADDNSLTRTKASHVKTIHYGLRRIYRESASWWHKCAEGRPVMPADNGGRPFPIPLGIARGTPTGFDCVVVADFSSPEVVETMRVVEDRVLAGERVCLFHVPDYLGWYKAPVVDAVFELCQKYGLGFAHPGLRIEATEVLLLDTKILEYPPAESVLIEGLTQVSTSEGCAATEAERRTLLDYFSNGGVRDARQSTV